MKLTLSSRVHGACLALAAFVLTAPPVLAQHDGNRGAPSRVANAPRHTASVTLALVPNVGQPEATVAVLRRPTGAQRDVMLVSDRATPRDLARAIQGFARLRERIGDDNPKEIRGYIKPDAGGPKVSGDELAEASDALKRLKKASESNVRGVGRSPSVEVEVAARKR